ncbi:hypothetical protein B0H16DRAFT_1884415 [Mycena metata]|uniref:Uncharacterized protein n=1 Tax=Mycena metata TaxID=1033252 RepID=A0AAD7NG69_9AGAR|nr:hypothetical protein B0H16DRAFT_1884415 [Mycena metata]
MSWGIGMNQLTQTIELALPRIDGTTTSRPLAMAPYLVKHDGLFVGSTSACNLIACVRFVKKMGWWKGERIGEEGAHLLLCHAGMTARSTAERSPTPASR